jgi:hypothetical protein
MKFKAYELPEKTLICESYTFAGLIPLIRDVVANPVPELFEVRAEGDDFNYLIPTRYYARPKKVHEHEARAYIRTLRAKVLKLRQADSSLTPALKKLLSLRCNVYEPEDEQVQQYIATNQLEFLSFQELLESEKELANELD